MGQLAQGKAFEKIILDTANLCPFTFLIKIPEEVRAFHSRRGVQVKTPFDFAGSVRGNAVFFDAKSTQEKTFLISSTITHPKKKHQLEGLVRASSKGAMCGYLFWFMSQNLFTFIPVKLITQLIRSGVKRVDPYTKGVITWEGDHINLSYLFLSPDDLPAKPISRSLGACLAMSAGQGLHQKPITTEPREQAEVTASKTSCRYAEGTTPSSITTERKPFGKTTEE